MYYFGAPELRKRTPRTVPMETSGVAKAPKKPRALRAVTGSAPITSINTPVGGEPDVSVNNERVTMVFEGPTYTQFYRQYTEQDIEDRFWFVPFQNPENSMDDPDQLNSEINPSDGIRPRNEDLVEGYNVFKVIIRPERFTTGNTLPVLAANYPGARRKIKFAPRPGQAPGTGIFPYYYIEVYRGPGQPMKKIWGVMPVMGTEPGRNAGFGKSNSEIKYLKRFV
jgi:hypothetical protein